MLKNTMYATIIVLCQSLLFISFTHAEEQLQIIVPAGDKSPPIITHEHTNPGIQAGSNTEITASVTDNVGIKTVTLFYRIKGEGKYISLTMKQVAKTNKYSVTLGAEDTKEPGIEYYIQATDLSGNANLSGYSFSPLRIAINAKSPDKIFSLPAPSVIKNEPPLPNLITEETTTPVVADKNPFDIPAKKKKNNTWLWIGLGALAVGAIAASSGDDGGGDPSASPSADTGNISFNAPAPGN